MPNPENSVFSWPRLNREQDVVVWAQLLVDRLRRLLPGSTMTTLAEAKAGNIELPPAADYEGRMFVLLADNTTVRGAEGGDVVVPKKAVFVSNGLKWVQIV